MSGSLKGCYITGQGKRSAAPLMKSIGFILNADWQTQRSGAATFTRALLKGLGERGLEFCVVPMRQDATGGCRGETDHCAAGLSRRQAASRPPVRSRARRGGVAGWRLACGYLAALARDVRHLWRQRRKLRGRVLAVNEFGCETMPIAARLVYPRATVLALGHTHPGDNPYARHAVRAWVEKLCYWSVSDIVFNSGALQREWARVLSIPRIKGCVIHYGIAAPGGEVPEDYPSKPRGCIDVLCASRFVRWKGHRELLQAFHRAARHHPSASNHPETECPHPLRLILIGDGPTLSESIAYARELGLNTCDLTSGDYSSLNGPEGIVLGDAFSSHCPEVIFLGSRPNASRYFSGADIGIQLSIEAEAFGLVFLEAMACGTPVIGTKIGGIPEVVGDAGILVAAGDIRGAADAIGRLAKSPVLREKLGARGRCRWGDEFTQDRMVEEYIAKFENLQ